MQEYLGDRIRMGMNPLFDYLWGSLANFIPGSQGDPFVIRCLNS